MALHEVYGILKRSCVHCTKGNHDKFEPDSGYHCIYLGFKYKYLSSYVFLL